MRPLRVIHVSLGLHLGGMEKLLVEFARHADRARFDLHFLSLTTAGDAAELIRRTGWPVTALNERPGLRVAMPLRLRRLFRQSGTDLVHTHNTRPLLYAAPGARLAGVRAVVHTRHGQRLGASRRQTILFNLAARCADRIVSVSTDSTELACAQGISRDRAMTIRNGIDVSRIPYRKHVANGPVVFVGRLSAEKDVGTLLRAMAILRQRGGRQRLLIAGDGPARAELQSLCTSLGSDNQINFLGVERDVPSLLSRASILVLPSLSEGISLALLEAMAAGVPTIATCVGGNTEVVLDGQTGILVPISDPDALASAIAHLSDHPAFAGQISIAARHRVETEFDVQQMIRRYEDLYESITGRLQDNRRAA